MSVAKVLRSFIWIGLIVLLSVAAIGWHQFAGDRVLSNIGKKHAMLRLEDIGPGGYYASEESLGQLRAVFEMLSEQKVPFHLAVVPHWIYVGKDGSRYEKGIDRDASQDPYLQKFISLLQSAERQGAVLGMHGYTHQHGLGIRKDGNHNSGIGVEFKVPGAPETEQAAYAADRIERSLQAFTKAGLHPRFWESPHYVDTREQEEIFRSYTGILYEPDFFTLRSFRDVQVYEDENEHLSTSLGSVYIPAPLKYVHDGNTAARIVSSAADYEGLASLYVHPFLEFAYLEPVHQTDGTIAMRDGLPEFRYKQGTSSPLHTLVAGLRQEGYRWMSIGDAIPFTPAHRIQIAADRPPEELHVGDITGRGHADIVIRYSDQLVVYQGDYSGPRNRTALRSTVWLQKNFAPTDQLTLYDRNRDGKQDLLHYDGVTGNVLVYQSAGSSLRPPVLWQTLPARLKKMNPIRREREIAFLGELNDRLLLISDPSNPALPEHSEESNKRVFAQDSKSSELKLPPAARWGIGAFQRKDKDDVLVIASDGSLHIYPTDKQGRFTSPISLQLPAVNKKEQVLVSDTDGDKLSDLTVYQPDTGVWTIYRNYGNLEFKPLDNAYGPWSRGSGRTSFSADFDGNGKADIASYDPQKQVVDLSLSYQTRERP